ncbi:NADAR family protein [Dyella sp.]|uniref:NADAR family protein n=1 Tax=Dyella sp. TaxID=1869338 RepID=UPI002B463A7D|nr:NADAR family protein [Dyella sp.]HKT26803.1 NADAR family protein [Dyella sp.]
MSRSAAPKKSAKAASKQADIPFYRSNEKPYGAFSNLFRRAMVFEGREYPTAEHAYQAGKARKESVREWILSAPTPSLVAMAAHGLYTWDITPDWSRTKFDRMRNVLRAKFTQHEDLKELLLSTGSSRLVEVGRTDNLVNRTWGEVNGKGLNMLGVLLMEVREEIRGHSKLQAKATSKKAKQSKQVNGSRSRDAARAMA